MPDEKDAEIARLREELRATEACLDASNEFRQRLRYAELQQVRRRVKDGWKLPSGVYELVQDHARIEDARRILDAVWHRDEDEYRKAMMHLTKLEWDLRKRLQDYL